MEAQSVRLSPAKRVETRRLFVGIGRRDAYMILSSSSPSVSQ